MSNSQRSPFHNRDAADLKALSPYIGASVCLRLIGLRIYSRCKSVSAVLEWVRMGAEQEIHKVGWSQSMEGLVHQ